MNAKSSVKGAEPKAPSSTPSVAVPRAQRKIKRVRAPRIDAAALDGLERINQHAVGIDVGGSQNYVCVPASSVPVGQPTVRAFGVFTSELDATVAWLKGCGITTVAMEATGIYWMALCDKLEARAIPRRIRHRALHSWWSNGTRILIGIPPKTRRNGSGTDVPRRKRRLREKDRDAVGIQAPSEFDVRRIGRVRAGDTIRSRNAKPHDRRRLNSGFTPQMGAGNDPPMSEVTQLLGAMDAGNPQAADQLLPLVYEELPKLATSKMARKNPGLTLQPTALVHEAWLRLAGDAQPNWENRAHFFGAAAEAMRRILVDRARRRLRQRHGGGLERVDIDEMEIAAPTDNDEDLLAMHDALDRFAALDPEKAEFVKLRYFVGLSLEEAASALGVSLTTAKRWWQYARSWLKVEMRRN